MLQYQLTKNHAGLTLWGDYWSLNALHKLVHDIVDTSITIPDKECFILGLAYEIRHAYEGQRYKDHIEHFEDRCPIYGVDLLWPMVITQLATLRHAMSFIPTSRTNQSVMYGIEAIVETALQEAIPDKAAEIQEWSNRLSSENTEHLAEILDSRCKYFIGLPAKQRLEAIPQLLETLTAMYENSVGIESLRDRFLHPSNFDNDHIEWPQFEW